MAGRLILRLAMATAGAGGSAGSSGSGMGYKEDPRDSRHDAGVEILGTTHNKSNAGHKGAEMVFQACPKDSWGTVLTLRRL